MTRNVAVCFKHLQSKFSDVLGECCAKYLDSYTKVARDFNLTGKKYLHHLLIKNALRSYLIAVKLLAITFQIAADMISAQNNSHGCQSQVQNFLDRLSVEQLMSTKLDELASLDEV